MLADARDAFLQRTEHTPGQVFLHGFVLGGALAGGTPGPFFKSIVTYKGKRFASVMSGGCSGAVQLGRVFQRGDGQKDRFRHFGMEHMVCLPLAIKLVDIFVVVEPVIARIQPGGAQIHIHCEEQTQSRGRVDRFIQFAAQFFTEMLAPDQFLEGNCRVSVTDHIRGGNFLPAREPYPAHTSIFYQDTLHRRLQAEFTPGTLQRP